MDNCLLCGTYQKFYSSLKSLYDFSKTEDFFDMISCLDKFFSEFRSITFVLQKSINGTQYEDVYSNLKNKYLCNETMKWFINKRNETLKEMPFNLRRVIVVDVYFFGKSKKIIDSSYTYENWTNINKIKSEIKKDLKQYNFPEIYLSTKLRFMDGEKDIDIFELIKYGINSMSDFLHDFDKDVNIECRRCKKLKET